jgi:hypothetical protein
MSVQRPWNEPLDEPLLKEHIIQLYREERFVVEAIAIFAGQGLGKGGAGGESQRRTNHEAISSPKRDVRKGILAAVAARCDCRRPASHRDKRSARFGRRR